MLHGYPKGAWRSWQGGILPPKEQKNKISFNDRLRLIHDVDMYCVRTRERTSCILGMTEDQGRMLMVADEDIIG
ncbi:hypothetical protein FBY58_1825 [Zymomonas mobilis]|uniref:Uncharacterized protein n=1 Tax=Zymomonas mobilis TaxID=542 RepID=A0A542VUF5_ZYMMB|nr:hypothetical protein [Zymomonas mobilis]TQL14958.1 hypothetical protein FBY58_1825 [Zymomonas mobilis]